MAAVEALQPKVDRRMAELSGSVRGPREGPRLRGGPKTLEKRGGNGQNGG